MGNSAATPVEKDTVVFRQIGRGPYAPSITPFAVKLETYFRMAKIPYVNIHGNKKSPKGKFPWIEYNGVALGDSQLIINFMNKERGVDLSSQLSGEERGTARAFQIMAEEHLYWGVVLERWVYDKEKTILKKTLGSFKPLIGLISRQIKDATYKQGLGRHSYEEVTGILEEDMKALSQFLGSKSFLMGDVPCEADCAIFGQLSQIRWQLNGSMLEKLILEKYTNLKDYCERMKDAFWPDWDDCTTRGFTATATK